MSDPKPVKRTLLQAEHIIKHYGPVCALQDVSLSLKSGEWLGLLGPNGAGKTTLMRILAGLLPADRGERCLVGESVNLARPGNTSLHLGLVPQDIALYAKLTAVENLQIFGRLHGLKHSLLQEKIDWALSWTGLDHRKHNLVSSFSGGMKRRLNIACGVLHDPDVVLLDEPTVGVDPHARQKIWEMLGDLAGRGMAILHSSHQLDEVETACDRVMILDHGEVIGNGPMDALRKTPGQIVRMRFDGPPPENFFGPSFKIAGNQVEGLLEHPQKELKQLLQDIEKDRLELLELSVHAPRLEDLFRELTGRELRE